MAYSNAIYFRSHFNNLTDEILAIFNIKQKLQKKIQTKENHYI